MRIKTDKEKLNREIRFKVTPTFYKGFEDTCLKQSKTVSEALRHLMFNFIKENKE